MRTKLSTKAFELVGSRPSFARSQPKNVVISLAMTTIAVPVILPPNHRLLNRQQNNIDTADLTEQTTVLKDEYLLRTKHQQVRANIGTQLGIFLDVQEESLVLEISRIFARCLVRTQQNTMSSLSDHDDDCNTGDKAPKLPTTFQIIYTNIDTANPTVETTVLNNPNLPRTTYQQVVDEKALTTESHLMFSRNPCPGT